MYYLTLLWGNISDNSKLVNRLYFLCKHRNFLFSQTRYHNPASLHQTHIYSVVWKSGVTGLTLRSTMLPQFVITIVILGKLKKTKYPLWRHLRLHITTFHFCLVLQLLHFLLCVLLSRPCTTKPLRGILGGVHASMCMYAWVCLWAPGFI